jgi:hypothetical protein
VGGEPGVFLIGEALEIRHLAKCGYDLREGSRFGGWASHYRLVCLHELLLG